jgi:hypothetical protein
MWATPMANMRFVRSAGKLNQCLAFAKAGDCSNLCVKDRDFLQTSAFAQNS